MSGNPSRPPPLRLNKESRKIRKQQLAPLPPPEAKSQHHPPPPVIIYSVSPKKIYVEQNEFMSLVQRLTGPDSTSPSQATAFREDGGGASIDDGVEMPQNLFWHADDSNPSSSSLPQLGVGLHGNMNVNKYWESNLISAEMMNVPSPSNLDLFNSFDEI